MCISVARVDLGPADALLDLEEGLLVLRPTLTRPEQLAAARKAMRAGGVRQSVVGVTCRCGMPLLLPPSMPPAPIRLRLSRSVSLIAAGLVTLLGGLVALPEQATAVDDPFEADRWRSVAPAVVDECTRERDPGHELDHLRCSSRWGPIEVRAWIESNELPEYRFRLVGSAPVARSFAVLRFFTTPAFRDDWLDAAPAAIALGDDGAWIGPHEALEGLA